MDERWEEDVKEFGAVNITGFRIVDTTRPYVRNFLRTWMSLDTNLFPGAGSNYISVSTCSPAVPGRGMVDEREGGDRRCIGMVVKKSMD